jgi:hypothetical protein
MKKAAATPQKVVPKRRFLRSKFMLKIWRVRSMVIERKSLSGIDLRSLNNLLRKLGYLPQSRR